MNASSNEHDGLRTRNFVTWRVLDDYERLFKGARVRERIDEGVVSCGGVVRRTHQVYRASASRWCKCRTLIGQCNYVELIDTIFTDVEGVD